jgi:hypothetical protein
MTITSRELNRLTNERNLFNAQLNVVLPAMHYLLKRLSDSKIPCTKWDADIIESVNKSLRARTDEEVETIVSAHNNKLMDGIDQLFAGEGAEEAIRKLFESLRGVDPAQSAEDPRDDEDPFDKMDADDFKKYGDGFGEPGFDDFRDENGNDTWPKN